MSVPLPHGDHRVVSSMADSEKKDRIVPSVHIHDLYLDSDERYDVFVVKVADRPHLLHYASPSSPVEDDCTEDDDEKKLNVEQLPLLDGCDIPGWRKDGLIPVPDGVQSVLNIGSASTMFRRETQWPLSLCGDSSCCLWKGDGLTNNNNKWDMIQRMACFIPSNAIEARTVHYEEYSTFLPIPAATDRKTTRFALEFERHNTPAKILGCTVGWSYRMPCDSGDNNVNQRLMNNSLRSDAKPHTDNIMSGPWTFANLVRRYGNTHWRFSDTHGELMSLWTYSKYITNPEGLTDDSPLAIYDSEFGNEDSPTRDLRSEYSIPTCFSSDLFDLALPHDPPHSNNDRPPWRWILIGPARSGTGLHIDPLWTNAWVTVMEGRKRWMLFPPTVPRERIGMTEGESQLSSVLWFLRYYELVTAPDWPKEWRPVHVLQEPGETVFVPNGWPHVVLNLELTVAITHNYASEFGPTLDNMWNQVVRDEPDFAQRWYQGLKHYRPDLTFQIQTHTEDCLK